MIVFSVAVTSAEVTGDNLEPQTVGRRVGALSARPVIKMMSVTADVECCG